MTHRAPNKAEVALERTFFELEAGLDLAELALHDAIETSNDSLRKVYASDKDLERSD